MLKANYLWKITTIAHILKKFWLILGMLCYIHIQALLPWSGLNSYLNLCIYLPLWASYGQGRIQPYIIVRCHWYNPFVSYSIAEVSIPWQSRPENLWINSCLTVYRQKRAELHLLDDCYRRSKERSYKLKSLWYDMIIFHSQTKERKLKVS